LGISAQPHRVEPVFSSLKGCFPFILTMIFTDAKKVR
jgi:hypothetical protein